MKNITAETTVGEIVRAYPSRAKVFENLGISYCCGGKKPLAEACEAEGLDSKTVIAMLSALDVGPEEATVDPDAMTLTELCDHIEQVHHGYLREELPRLDHMTRKVAAVHGDNEPRLLDLRRVFEKFNVEMSEHTTDENENVFPTIRRLDKSNGEKNASLKDEFAKLQAEHEDAGSCLVQFRELTDSFVPPDWACNTFRALYDGLQRMEKDMHQHIHKENNVLFPKALAAG